jgi:hypothetical protein
VEIDGPTHDPEYDAYRDEYNFRRSGIVVLRVRNRNEHDMSRAIVTIASLGLWSKRRKELGIEGNRKDRRRLSETVYDGKNSLLAAYLQGHAIKTERAEKQLLQAKHKVPKELSPEQKTKQERRSRRRMENDYLVVMKQLRRSYPRLHLERGIYQENRDFYDSKIQAVRSGKMTEEEFMAWLKGVHPSLNLYKLKPFVKKKR